MSNYAMQDMLNQKTTIEIRRKMIDEAQYALKCHFDPRGMSIETWMSYYDEIKLFLPKLTKKNFKDMLINHRELYERRAEKKMWKRYIPEYFESEKIGDRVFPLSPLRYKDFFQSICLRKKVKKVCVKESKLVFN